MIEGSLNQRFVHKAPSINKWTNTLLPVLMVIVFASVSSIVDHTWGLSDFLLDYRLQVKASSASHAIAVVEISEPEWTEIFRGSPLNPAKLGALLTAIARGGPKAIAIDIDTSDPKFQALRKYSFQQSLVVWGATADKNTDSPHQFIVSPPVGGLGEVGSPNVGVAVMPRDRDGVIRGYWREVLTQVGDVPTLGFAAVSLSRSRPGSLPRTADTEPRLLSFSRRLNRQPIFDTYSAGTILQAAKDRAWRNRGFLQDKIVLVGGFYDKEHELYWTPVGQLWGVEIIGEVIDTELQNPDGGHQRPSAIVEVITNSVVVASLLVVVYSELISLVMALVLSVSAAVVLSFWWTHSAANWSYFIFIPIALLLGEILHRIGDHVRERIHSVSQ